MPMSNISVRSAVFLATCAMATSVYGDVYGNTATYQISGAIIDKAMVKNIVGTDTESSFHDLHISTFLDGSIGGASGNAFAAARAGHGELGVDIRSMVHEDIIGTSLGGGGQFQNSATARFFDFLTIIAGPPGTPGIVHSLFHLRGSVTASSIGYIPPTGGGHDYVDATAHAILGISGTGIDPGHGPYPAISNSIYAYATDDATRDIGHEEIIQDNAPATIPVDEPFVSGIPFFVTYTMTAESYTTLEDGDFVHKESGQAASEADFANTLAWGGITSVTDSHGVPIAGWTVTSASGFDYSKPATVPEPSTFVLLAIALPSLLLARRHTAGSA